MEILVKPVTSANMIFSNWGPGIQQEWSRRVRLLAAGLFGLTETLSAHRREIRAPQVDFS